MKNVKLQVLEIIENIHDKTPLFVCTSQVLCVNVIYHMDLSAAPPHQEYHSPSRRLTAPASNETRLDLGGGSR